MKRRIYNTKYETWNMKIKKEKKIGVLKKTKKIKDEKMTKLILEKYGHDK